MTSRLREHIDDGRVHVMDGAMGTVLYARGMFVNVCYDELNLTHPALVRGVHETYLRAGAEIIETNTFGANPVKLSGYGLDEQTEAINRAAALLACEAAGESASVIGSIGPLGIRIEPFGPTGRDEATAFFGRQVTGLIEGGVHGFILETFSDLDELRSAFAAVRERSALPIFALTTVDEKGSTTYGTEPERIAAILSDMGADVIGLNCSVGPAVMLDALERMAEVAERPLAALPNAGLPRLVGDRKIYLSSPEYMANYAVRMIEAGARFVGGCCGTTEDHIKRIRDEVATLQPRQVQVIVSRDEVTPAKGIEAAVRLAERSTLGEKLAAGTFVTNVELPPTRGWRADLLLEQARELKETGVDTVSILDGARARSSIAAIPAATLVQQRVGIETIVHYTCRDRNMLGMLSDMLGAAAADLNNVLLVTGDPPRFGPYPESTAVFDIDSIGLTNLVYRLNHGTDPGGNALGEPTRFVIGVAANHMAVDMGRELKRLYWKVDAGADFVVTQPIFDIGPFDAFARRAEEFEVPIIAGIWPLVSLRHAEFLANEVPGQSVPAGVMNRMRRAQERGPEAATQEGLAIARETLQAVRNAVQGVHLSLPRGRVDIARAVLQA